MIDMVLAESPVDLNFNTLIALGALVAAVIAILMKFSDKSVSRNEYDEFKRNTDRHFKAVEEQAHRDFDRIETDLRLIDATKPSAGELQEAMRAIGARVGNLEESVRHFRPSSNSK